MFLIPSTAYQIERFPQEHDWNASNSCQNKRHLRLFLESKTVIVDTDTYNVKNVSLECYKELIVKKIEI